MFKLEKSEALDRLMRRTSLSEMGKLDSEFIREAIKAGRTEEALALLDYGLAATKRLIASLTLGRELLLSRLSGFGDEEIEEFYRERYTPWVKQWMTKTPGPMESMEVFADLFRVMGSGLRYAEEPDKYVMTLDPCGSGGTMRRTMDVRKIEKAYPWTWNKTGVSYYCAHCCLFQEILPIEMRGYPICVTQYSDDPKKPCVHLYYKSPELIPDEYFTRIGQTPWRLRKGKEKKKST